MKRNRAIFYLIFLFEGMVFYSSISTLYRQAAGLSILQITAIESISLVVSFLLELPWGIIADRIGYRRTMILSAFFYLLSKIVFWIASGYWMFLMERILLSVAIAGMSGCDMGMLYRSCEKEDSQKAFGICHTMQISGTLFAALVYSVFLGGQYRKAGLLTVVSYGIVFLLAFGLKEVDEKKVEDSYGTDSIKQVARQSHKESKEDKHAEMEKIHERVKTFVALLEKLIKDKRQLAFLLSVALLSEVHQTITVFLGQLQYIKGGLSPKYFGYLFMLMSLVGMTAAFSFKFTKCIGRKKLMVMLYAMAGVACLVLAVTDQMVMSILAMIILRMTFGIFEPLQMQIQNEKVTVSERATVLSMNAIILESTGAVTNIAFGRLADLSLSYAMLFGAVLCIIGGILIYKIEK